jgi:hypothetical protein
MPFGDVPVPDRKSAAHDRAADVKGPDFKIAIPDVRLNAIPPPASKAAVHRIDAQIERKTA